MIVKKPVRNISQKKEHNCYIMRFVLFKVKYLYKSNTFSVIERERCGSKYKINAVRESVLNILIYISKNPTRVPEQKSMQHNKLCSETYVKLYVERASCHIWRECGEKYT